MSQSLRNVTSICNITLKGSNDGALHSVLLFLWTWSIVQYYKNKATKFRQLALPPSLGENAYPVGSDRKGKYQSFLEY
jgi:hypothetical protein